MQRGKESLSVNGKLSESTEEKLFVKLENFNLENVSRIALKHRPFLFCIQPVALSWSHKVEDVFSGIVEHDQIRGIL